MGLELHVLLEERVVVKFWSAAPSSVLVPVASDCQLRSTQV